MLLQLWGCTHFCSFIALSIILVVCPETLSHCSIGKKRILFRPGKNKLLFLGCLAGSPHPQKTWLMQTHCSHFQKPIKHLIPKQKKIQNKRREHRKSRSHRFPPMCAYTSFKGQRTMVFIFSSLTGHPCQISAADPGVITGNEPLFAWAGSQYCLTTVLNRRNKKDLVEGGESPRNHRLVVITARQDRIMFGVPLA